MILHFGFEQYLALTLYVAGVLALLMSLFWRPLAGILYLVPLIPLQTTRYRLNQYPLGESLVGVILIGVAIGLLRQRRWILPMTPWTPLLAVYALYTFATLFLNSNNLEPRFKEWQDYMLMPLLFFLVAASVTSVREMRVVVLLMCFATLVLDRSFWGTVSDRDYSTFSRDLQEGGAMGYAGVQGMSAFNAQFAWFLAALSGVEPKKLLRWAYLALAFFCSLCVVYTFSRGGYVAFFAGWLLVGFLKQRWLLLVLTAFLLTWTAIVPNAVRERVEGTYDANDQLDRSSEIRLELWNDALELYKANPIAGSGFHTYAYMKRVGNYEDTHNIYLKVLIETGMIGLFLFILVLAQSFRLGLRLFRTADDPFLSSLGLGLAAWMVCTATASLFGDRWTYLQINGYLWVLAGLVARGFEISATAADESGGEVPQPAKALTKPRFAMAGTT